jgi:hypothetical protein
LAVFFIARYAGVQVRLGDGSGATAGPGVAAAFMEMLVDLSDYLGVVLPIALCVILLLIVTIMLIGRLIGVSHVTFAFCWAVLLMVLMFPWQTILNSGVVRAGAEVYSPSGGGSAAVSPTTAPSGFAVQQAPDVRIPGALYTWPELAHDYDFPGPVEPESAQASPGRTRLLKWTRFVAYPVAMIVVLTIVHLRSRRGLRLALGEAEPAEPPPPLLP